MRSLWGVAAVIASFALSGCGFKFGLDREALYALYQNSGATTTSGGTTSNVPVISPSVAPGITASTGSRSVTPSTSGNTSASSDDSNWPGSGSHRSDDWDSDWGGGSDWRDRRDHDDGGYSDGMPWQQKAPSPKKPMPIYQPPQGKKGTSPVPYYPGRDSGGGYPQDDGYGHGRDRDRDRDHDYGHGGSGYGRGDDYGNRGSGRYGSSRDGSVVRSSSGSSGSSSGSNAGSNGSTGSTSGSNRRSGALTGGESGMSLGETCGAGSDLSNSNLLCLGLKYVVYRNPDTGLPVEMPSDVISNIEDINRIWGECGIGFQVDTYLAADPERFQVRYRTANYDELNAIRNRFGDDRHLLVVLTGEWNRRGSLGSTPANAWTNMPGDGVYGAILEGSVRRTPNLVAHELGHYLGLGHVDDWSDLMNPVVAPNSRRLTREQCRVARQVIRESWADVLR